MYIVTKGFSFDKTITDPIDWENTYNIKYKENDLVENDVYETIPKVFQSNLRLLSVTEERSLVEKKNRRIDKRIFSMIALFFSLLSFAQPIQKSSCENQIGIVYTMSGGGTIKGPAMNLELVGWHVNAGIIAGFGLGSYPEIEETKNNDEAALLPYFIAGYRLMNSDKYKLLGTVKVNIRKTTTFSIRGYRLLNESLMIGLEPFYQYKNSGALAVITMRFN